MSGQIEFLIQLQDLDLMIRELGNEKAVTAEKKLGFEISGIETLTETRQELAKKIDAELLRRYERLQSRFPRAIVPMRDGVCFGCFVRVPAQRSVGDLAKVEACEHCGRILFRFRFP